MAYNKTMNKLLTPWAYTICFCIYKDKVLLLYRKKEPNKSLWNGLGGKIEENETPRENVFREINEEANIDLSKAESITFAGIITWHDGNNISPQKGMYAYIAKFSDESDLPIEDHDTDEGILSWKPIKWVTNHNNPEVVSNIPYFLPLILYNELPLVFALKYNKQSMFKNMLTKPISKHILNKLKI